MKGRLLALCLFLMLTGCATYQYEGNVSLNEPLVSFAGNSLSGDEFSLPEDLSGQTSILLFGYVQNAQFDIDRWLIGLDMRENVTPVYEIPAIKGFFPKLFRNTIDDGMRKGIPDELWSIVITVYDDGDKVQAFTGNQNPNNARAIVIDEAGNVRYFYDRGFSVDALNNLLAAVNENAI